MTLCEPQRRILLTDFDGVYNDFEDSVFNAFTSAYIDNDVYFNGERLIFKSFPIEEGKPEAFWHMTSTNHMGIRYPDLRRYETVLWTKHILGICFFNKNKCNKAWRKRYKSKHRILILCEELQYIIVLEERKGYLLFITSYPVSARKIDKFLDEYESDNVSKL